jgi:hypothetical protein
LTQKALQYADPAGLRFLPYRATSMRDSESDSNSPPAELFGVPIGCSSESILASCRSLSRRASEAQPIVRRIPSFLTSKTKAGRMFPLKSLRIPVFGGHFVPKQMNLQANHEKTVRISKFDDSRIHLWHPQGNSMRFAVNHSRRGSSENLNTLSELLTELRVGQLPDGSETYKRNSRIINHLRTRRSGFQVIFWGWHEACE